LSSHNSYRRVFITGGSSSGGGTGGSSSEFRLTYPTDGSWTDGLVPIHAGDRVDDAIDGINEILAELAPSPPAELSSFSVSPVPVNGKVPNGLSTNWSAATPGSQVSVLNSATLTINFAAFGPGDTGTFLVYRNGTVLVILDIGSNFVEDSRSGDQDLSLWDVQGSGNPITDGLITFTGGSLQVLHCGIYNDFKKWQSILLRLMMTSVLIEGLNHFEFSHVSDSEQRLSWEIYYDDDHSTLSFSSAPAIVESTPSYAWLSGIRYYGLGSTFAVSFVATNCFKKTYHPTQVSQYSMPGLSVVTRNPASVPVYTDDFSVSDSGVSLNASGVMNINARLSVTLRDPYGGSLTTQSSSENRLVDTCSQTSTDKAEYFKDEVYRLPAGSYSSVPSPITGQWDSSIALISGQAQCYNAQLVIPTINFTSGYLPSQPGRNYSLITGDSEYYRAFRANGVPHSSVTLTIPGSPISSAGTGMNVFVKLSGVTGWLDAGTMFSLVSFSGADNDGCLVSKSGNNYALTFGTFSTDQSGWMIIVKVVLRDTTYMSSLVTNW
jgi:hypothetical protein